MGRGGKKQGGPSSSVVFKDAPSNLLQGTGLENNEDVTTSLQNLLDNRPENVRPQARKQGNTPLPEGAPRVVGIFGKAQSGKDAAVDYLQEKYSGIYRMAFSDTVIDEANRILAAEGIVISQETKALLPVRRFLQALGMARVQQDPMYWGKQVQEKIERAQKEGHKMILVTGIRTEADCELLRSLGAPLWKVNRPGNTYKAEHSIEAEIDNLEADLELVNNKEGDLSPLYGAAERAISS